MLERRSSIQARLNEILDDYSDGTLSRDEFKRTKARVSVALEDVQSRLDAVHSSNAISGLLSAGESVRDRWERETTGWRRQLIDMLIEDIAVNPSAKKPRYFVDGKRYYFDTGTVNVQWRV